MEREFASGSGSSGVAYRSLARAIEARQLQTAIADAVFVDVDEPVAQAITVLRENRFDQAPARRKGRLVGHVVTEELLLGRLAVHRLDETSILSGAGSILDVMQSLLAPTLLTFVVDGHAVTGFITPSDLNKHPARAHFYLLLADLEIALAGAARAHFDNQNDALELLEAKDRKKIRNRYDRDSRQKVEVDLVAGMDLEHLLRIAGSDAGLRQRFGVPDASTWALWTEPLPSLRNAVMHPVLEFLGRRRSIDDLVTIERRVREMLEHAVA